MWPVMAPFAKRVESSTAPSAPQVPSPGIAPVDGCGAEFPAHIPSRFRWCLLWPTTLPRARPQIAKKGMLRQCVTGPEEGYFMDITARPYEYAKRRQAGHLPKMPER
jgi:hypothetical protein